MQNRKFDDVTLRYSMPSITIDLQKKLSLQLGITTTYLQRIPIDILQIFVHQMYIMLSQIFPTLLEMYSKSFLTGNKSNLTKFWCEIGPY